MSVSAVPRPSRVSRALIAILRLGVAGAEIWIAYAWFVKTVSPVTLLAAHAALVGLIFFLAWSFRAYAGTGLWTDSVILLLTGPLAVISLLRHGPPTRDPMRDSSNIVASTACASQADRIDAQIVADRRPRCAPENGVSLMDRITSCDLEEQQAAVAMLSTIYRNELHPVLMAGLQSPTPVIRVQSAAVFAKLRERFGAEARKLLAFDLTDDPALEPSVLAAACRDLARSPFADDRIATSLCCKADALHPEADEVIPPGRDLVVRMTDSDAGQERAA